MTECRWAAEPIKIDGLADEAAWQAAQTIDGFGMPWLNEKARSPLTATRARLLWDREYFYFYADMDDSDLYADVTEHDGVTWNNDVFEMFLKPDDAKPAYFEFQVNAAGTTMDMFLPRRGAGGYGRFKSDGDFHLEAAVKLRGTLNRWQDNDQGWSVEGRIPWRDFIRTGGRPETGATWKFALCRYDYSVDFEGPELSTTAPKSTTPYPNFHAFEDYGSLKFIGPDVRGEINKPWGIDHLVPWTDSHVVGSPDPPSPYRVVRDYAGLKIPCPMALAHEPGTDNLLIVHQLIPWHGAGRIVRVKDDPQATQTEQLLALDGIAYGIAFHPDYPHNGYLYVGSNEPFDDLPKSTKVTRYTIDRQAPHRIVPGSAKVIIQWLSDGHNGGDLAFGADGLLYVSSGDGTSDSDKDLRGQDMTELTSKVLRIDVDHPTAGQNYSVPKDNPFVGQSSVRPETWAYGLRNPWRLSIDRRTGQLWVGNNGQDLWEQIYLIRRGENYGWSIQEGSHSFYPDRKQGPSPIIAPAAEHSHSEARSLTGGIAYYGKQLPELRGVYIYGDWSTGKIWGLRHDGTRATFHQELTDTTLQISGFGLDSRGELVIVDHGGGFYRLQPRPKDLLPDHFPQRLSETGVFQSVRDHQLHPALIPYSVNSPLWSDGAYKERFIGIPNPDHDLRRIDFKLQRGWGFPEGTVLVKSFALETESGKPQSRRWIETRLLTKQQNEWVGYSYAWNEDQNEAELVAAAGMDQQFVIKETAPSGSRLQTWHYPSRAECMVCHSRAANYVLGLSTLQMNKLHDYGGVQANQLRTLEHLGLLRVDWRDEAMRAIRGEGAERGLEKEALDEYAERQTATREKVEPCSSAMLYKAPEVYASLPDPSDAKQAIDDRARSYLHANCAQCHVEAGGGNAKLEMEFTTSADRTNLFDVPPLHDRFGINDASVIAHSARSIGATEANEHAQRRPDAAVGNVAGRRGRRGLDSRVDPRTSRTAGKFDQVNRRLLALCIRSWFTICGGAIRWDCTAYAGYFPGRLVVMFRHRFKTFFFRGANRDPCAAQSLQKLSYFPRSTGPMASRLPAKQMMKINFD